MLLPLSQVAALGAEVALEKHGILRYPLKSLTLIDH